MALHSLLLLLLLLIMLLLLLLLPSVLLLLLMRLLSCCCCGGGCNRVGDRSDGDCSDGGGGESGSSDGSCEWRQQQTNGERVSARTSEAEAVPCAGAACDRRRTRGRRARGLKSAQ